jgi:hypothetical protein
MKRRDLFRLSIGRYELTDNIDNYHYTLTVSLSDNNERCYQIIEKGSLSYPSIFMIEGYKEYEDGIKEKSLSALAGVGGLRIHSDDTYSVLNTLKIIQRESFQRFFDLTNISNLIAQ